MFVESWSGTIGKQSYSYLIKSNSTVSFTWGFQRTGTFNMVRPGQDLQINQCYLTPLILLFLTRQQHYWLEDEHLFCSVSPQKISSLSFTGK